MRSHTAAPTDILLYMVDWWEGVGGWVGGWVGLWMDGWMDGWVDGCGWMT